MEFGTLCSFQSPLHRGRYFNCRLKRWRSSAKFLSVPSSSGKVLQRSQQLAQENLQNPFSPLFIGEGTSTFSARRRRSARAITLSVPSSSGKVLQHSSPSLFGQGFPIPFSPLFIGEGTSTDAIALAEKTIRAFSPLFIGEGTSTRRGGGQLPRRSV